jgi:sRNA-binding carbon storage regulator CsrA
MAFVRNFGTNEVKGSVEAPKEINPVRQWVIGETSKESLCELRRT